MKRREIAYTADTGETVWLVVPWGRGSGRIPPPYVRFTTPGPGDVITFRYDPREES